MELKITLEWLLGGILPLVAIWAGTTIKQLVDIGAIKEHLKQLNGRVGKTENALDQHIISHTRKEPSNGF
jgi:hypothetical protein